MSPLLILVSIDHGIEASDSLESTIFVGIHEPRELDGEEDGDARDQGRKHAVHPEHAIADAEMQRGGLAEARDPRRVLTQHDIERQQHQERRHREHQQRDDDHGLRREVQMALGAAAVDQLVVRH